MKKLHILTLSMILSTGFMAHSSDVEMSDADTMLMQEDSFDNDFKAEQVNSQTKQKKEYQDPASKSANSKKKYDRNKSKHNENGKDRSNKKQYSKKSKDNANEKDRPAKKQYSSKSKSSKKPKAAAVDTDAIITADDVVTQCSYNHNGNGRGY